MRCRMPWSSYRGAPQVLAAISIRVAAFAQLSPAEPGAPGAPAIDIFVPAPAKPGFAGNALRALTPQAVLTAPMFLIAEERAAMLGQLQLELPDLAATLQLSADEIEQLLRLIMDRRVIERSAGIWGQPLLRSQPLLDDLQQRQVRIAALLGERIAPFRTYMESLPQRRRVRDFDVQLPAADRLSTEQKDQLVAVLVGAERIPALPPSTRLAVLPDDEEQAELAAKRFNVER